MSKHSRDDAIERALRGRRDVPDRAGGTAGCLDADTCAAWLDGTLDAGAREAAEAHVAACARCQAVLAVAVRAADSQPAAQAAPGEKRRLWHMLPWLGPLTAAAATAVIWVAVRPPTEPDLAPAPSAVVEPKSTPEGLGERDAARFGTSPAPVEPPPSPAAGAREAQSSARNTAPPASAESPARKAESQADSADARPLQRRDSDAVLRDRARSIAMPPADAPPAEARQIGPTPLPAAPPPPPAASSSRGAPPAAVAGAAAARTAAAPQAKSATVQEPQAMNFRTEAEAVAAPVIPSPDPNVLWRVVGGVAVQRSIDRGATWTPQEIGATGKLLAGAAPSSSVCWIVGARSAVFLTTDGRTWTRVAFPHEIDLIRVAAESATAATVTASDGRTFRTTDGGKTWGLR